MIIYNDNDKDNDNDDQNTEMKTITITIVVCVRVRVFVYADLCHSISRNTEEGMVSLVCGQGVAQSGTPHRCQDIHQRQLEPEDSGPS